MSNTYYWDLGFDFNAVQDPPGGPSYLENGFVLGKQMTVTVAGPGVSKSSAPATPVDLATGDTIVFNLFNTTTLQSGQQGSDFSINSGTISFSGAEVGQTIQSPFNASGSTTPQATFNMNTSAPLLQGQSVVFDGIQAPDAATQPTFPFWTVAGPLTVVNNGRFLMQVVVNITGPNGPRSFVVDPEMVVGSIG
jgi:hypothetical protein